MSLFMRASLVVFALMLPTPAIFLAWSDNDDAAVEPAEPKPQEAPKPGPIPVTHETRVRILERLLALAHDDQQTTDARIAAIRSVRPQADAHRPKARKGILELALGEDVPAELRIVASETLLRGGFNLSESQEREVIDGLWRLFVETNGEDESRRIRTQAGYVQLKFGSPPQDAAAVKALSAMALSDRPSSYGYRGIRVEPDDVARGLLANLPASEQGVRLLVKALASLETESPEEISIDEIRRYVSQSFSEDDLPRMRELAAQKRLELRREILASRLTLALPKTEGIAEILLQATSHENPAVREAAIRALGNDH